MTYTGYALPRQGNTISAPQESAMVLCSPFVGSLRARPQHGRNYLAGADVKRVCRTLTWFDSPHRLPLQGPSRIPAGSNHNFEQFNTLGLLALKEHLDHQSRLQRTLKPGEGGAQRSRRLVACMLGTKAAFLLGFLLNGTCQAS